MSDSEINQIVLSSSGEAFEGVKRSVFPLISDVRGGLSVVNEAELPFYPKRWFWVFNVPFGVTRGAHAHKVQKQFLICVQGSVTVFIDDGICNGEVELNQPNVGIYIPPMVWAEERIFSEAAVLLVFASDEFDPQEYIHEYEDYRRIVASYD